MINMNEVIAKNICERLSQLGKKKTDLANSLNYSKQTISKMLNGARMISAPELQKIATFCNTSMDELFTTQDSTDSNDLVKAFMGKVSSKEGKKGLETAEQLIKIYLFESPFQKEAFKKHRNQEWSDE